MHALLDPKLIPFPFWFLVFSGDVQHMSRRISLRTMLCIGGVDMRDQSDVMRRNGVHVVVATPGRLKDHLAKKRMNLDACR